MPIQDHIHLDLTAAGADGAPAKTWVISRYDIRPHVIQEIERSLTGKLFPHVMNDQAGVILFNDYSFTVKIVGDESRTAETKFREDLLPMLGKTVYFVPPEHPNAGSSHAASVKTMYCSNVGSIVFVNTMLTAIYVDIELTDNAI